MNLLDGIQLHELVLMILGFILGLVLIFVFLFMALRGRTNLKLLYGFIAPLVMIGYPSIQSISFSKDVVKIDKLVQKVNENPADTLAQHNLIEQIQTLPKSRCVTSTEALTTIAGAQSALGLYDSAKVTIQRAAERSPNSEKVQQTQQDIQQKWQIQRTFEQKVESIKSHLNELEKKPSNSKLVDTIAMRLMELRALDAPVRVQQSQAVLVAKAAAVVGQRQAAEQIADAVLTANPKQESAKTLKEELKNKVLERRYGKHVPPARTQTPPKNTEKPRTNSTPQPPSVQSPVRIENFDVLKLKFQLIPKAAEGLKKWDKEN